MTSIDEAQIHNNIIYGNFMQPNDRSLIQTQRKVFFDNQIAIIRESVNLIEDEIDDLWKALLAAEHPDYLSDRFIDLLPEVEQANEQPIHDDTAGFLGTLLYTWSSVWKEYQKKHASRLAARFVLKEESNKDELATHSAAEEQLKIALDRLLPSALSFMNIPDSLGKILRMRTSEGKMFELDARMLEYFKKKGGKGKFAKSFVAEGDSILASGKYSAEKRRNSWRQVLLFHRQLAKVIWRDQVRETVNHLKSKPPALSMWAVERVSDLMKQGNGYSADKKAIVDVHGRVIASIKDSNDIKVPAIEMEVINRMLSQKNIECLNSITAYRLFIWEALTTHEQFALGMVDARALRVPGSFAELAKRIGGPTSGKAKDIIHKVLAWQAHGFFDDGNGRCGNMLSYTIDRNGTKRTLTIVMGDMMIPGHIFSFNRGTFTDREARRLVPIRNIAPIYGTHQFGEQANFSMQLDMEIRKQASELYKVGGAYIPEERLLNLAHRAGLNPDLVPKVLDLWTQDGDEAPAYYIETEKNHYTLGDAYRNERAFIVESGEQEIKGQLAGKRGVAKKKNLGWGKISKPKA